MKLPAAVARLLDPTQAPTPPPPPPKPRPTGLYLGYGTKGPVLAGPEHHVLVLGPPRSGKTSRLVAPALRRHHGPAVVTSTKADILDATIDARSALGRCWYWDPSGTTVTPETVEPLTWSPVGDCEIWDRAVARAHSLATAGRPHQAAHDSHWVERAQALLAVLLHAAAVDGGDLACLLSWLHRRELLGPTAVLQERGSRRAADILQGIAHTEARELSGIFSTTDSILAAYRSDAAIQSTRNPQFDPDEFAVSTDTIYLVSPAATQAVHASLVVALLDQIRTAVYRRRPQPPMLYALDEAANIAPLPDLPATLAEGGSQGLIVMACLQDLSQARVRWDKAADGFLTLFTHKLVLPGIADTATLKAISTLAGDIDQPVRSDAATNTVISKTSTTWTTQRRPRLPPDQIASGPPGTAILLSGSHLSRVGV
jgi:type IV secretion system protein VirD4